MNFFGILYSEASSMYASGLSSECHSRIQLRVRCDGLAKADTFSESDPFAVILLNGNEIGRTEVIQNTLNPHFVKAFDIDYFFEELQTIIIRVSSPSHPLHVTGMLSSL